jgi:hypothetical protein
MPGAQDWIGQASPEDRLELGAIDAQLSQDANELRLILQSGKVSGLLRLRREAADTAAKAQKAFKRWSLIAVVFGAVATLASGLLLYEAGGESAAPKPPATEAGAPRAPQPPAPSAQPGAATPQAEPGLVDTVNKHHTVIVVIQIVGLFFSAIASAVLASTKQLDEWTTQRNEAEARRREVFDEVLNQGQHVQANSPPAPGSSALCQCLEFFRRYQHELQINYYRKALTRQGRTARRLTWLTAGLSGLAAITGALGDLGPIAVVCSAFLGIAVPVLLSAAQSWRATTIGGDTKGAYATAKDALEELLLNIDEVRRKAVGGDAPAVRQYFDSVHAVMSTETKTWKPTGRA